MYEVLEILQFLEIFLELDKLGILGGIKKKKGRHNGCIVVVQSQGVVMLDLRNK